MAFDSFGSKYNDIVDISEDEIDQINGGMLIASIAVISFAALFYQIGYARGENQGESETCPAPK